MLFAADVVAPSASGVALGIMATFVMSVSFVCGLSRLPALLIAEINPQGSRALVSSYAFITGSLLSNASSSAFEFGKKKHFLERYL